MTTYRKVTQAYGSHLLRECGTIFLTRFSAVRGLRLKCWRAYRAVERQPKGRFPWTVDNRRIGTEDGFPSLLEAIKAAESLANHIKT